MQLRNGPLFPAVLTLIAIFIVTLGAWFTLTHGAACELLFGACSATGVGVITVLTVLAAGGLLAFAFDRAEQAFVLFTGRSSDSSEDRD